MIKLCSYQKASKVEIACTYSKEGNFSWLEDSTLRSKIFVLTACAIAIRIP